MTGLLSMAALATIYTENHGHLEARTTEYAQDKMEQLLALVYTDAVTNTVVFPAATTGGTGLDRRRQHEHGRAGERLRGLAGIRRQPARRRHDSARRLVLRAGLADHIALERHQADHRHDHRPYRQSEAR